MDKFKAVFISIGGAITSFFGVLAIPVLLMVASNLIDYVTGIIASVKRGERVNSSVGLWGIIKKICMWLLVVVGVIVDELIVYATATIGWTLPFTFIVACVVCVWIICNELISILENIADIGVPVPAFLKKIINYVKIKSEETADIEKTDGDM